MSRTIRKSVKVGKKMKECQEHKYVLAQVCRVCGWVKPAPKPDPPLERPEDEPGYGHCV